MVARCYSEAPSLFAAQYAEQTGDVTFYARLASRYAAIGAVLELGVGTGRIFRHLMEANARAFGVERSAAMLSYLHNTQGGAASRCVRADCAQLPLPSRSFGLVIAPFNLLQELSEPGLRYTLAEVSRVLVPNGIFAADVAVPNETWLKERIATWWQCNLFRYVDTKRQRDAYLEAWMIQRSYNQRSRVSKREFAYVESRFGQDAKPYCSQLRVSYHARAIEPAELDQRCRELGLQPIDHPADFQNGLYDDSVSHVTIAQKAPQSR